MRIDYAIMSSNDNPLYLDFWEPVSKCWESLGITPLLFYFGEKNFSDKRIIKINKSNKFSEEIQTLWIRYYAPKLLDKNKTSIISDIDMLPLSEFYFIEQISSIPDDKYVHLNPCAESYGRIPSCYHVAKNEKFVEVLNLNRYNTFEESLSECIKYAEKSNGWFADENFATNLLMKSNKSDLIFIKRDGGQNGHRIDRVTNDHWAHNYSLDLISLGQFFDCHSIRPYSKYKNDIDFIVNKFINRRNIK